MMRITFQSSNWLRFRAKKAAKTSNPELFENATRLWWHKNKHIITSRESWWIWLIVVLVIYSGAIILGGGILNVIGISPSTARILIDQRASDVAVLMSISLVVLGFILSNLSEKGSFALALLFEVSFFYPIFYFTLLNIGGLFLSSMLRDELLDSSLIQVAVTGTYLGVTSLILIAYLFGFVLKFSNEEYLTRLYSKLLVNEVRLQLRESMVQSSASVIYKETLVDLGLSLYNEINDLHKRIFTGEMGYSGNSNPKRNRKTRSRIVDINMRRLSRYVKRIQSKGLMMEFRNVILGVETEDYDSYLVITGECDLQKHSRSLQRFIRKGRLDGNNEDPYKWRKIFQERLETFMKANDHHRLKVVLDSYILLFKEECSANQRDLNIGESVSRGIDSIILKAFRIAISQNDREMFQILNDFCKSVISISIRYRSELHFRTYINFFHYYYGMIDGKSLNIAPLSTMKDTISKESSKSLLNIIWLYLPSTSSRVIQSDIVPLEFYYLSYYSFSSLFHKIIQADDKVGLDEAVHNFSIIPNYQSQVSRRRLSRLNIPSDGKSSGVGSTNEGVDDAYFLELAKYSRQCINGIRYWTIYLFQRRRISVEQLSFYVSRLNYYTYDPEEKVIDLLRLPEDEQKRYLGWADWDFMERKEMKVYAPPSPSNWYILGFLIEVVMKSEKLYIVPERYSLSELAHINSICDKVQQITSAITEDFDYWNTFLKLDSVDEFNYSSGEFLSQLELLKHREFVLNAEGIANAQLIDTIINQFVTETASEWDRNAFVYHLFSSLSSVSRVGVQEAEFPMIGYYEVVRNGKVAFIDNGEPSSYGFSSIGRVSALSLDQAFLEKLSSSNHPIEGESITNLIESCLNNLKKSEFNPNVIVVSYQDSISPQLTNNALFTSKDVSGIALKGCLNDSFVGYFKEIPVYCSQHPIWNNFVFVGELGAAIKMNIKESVDWHDEYLFITVSEISDEQAVSMLSENPNYWTVAEDGTLLEEEDALLSIRKSVIITVEIQCQFSIENSKAYSFGKVVRTLPS
jgi:hypothetical protein